MQQVAKPTGGHMQTIQVIKPFILQHDPLTRKVRDPVNVNNEIEEILPSRKQYFDVGIYEVEDHIATHWYVVPHLKGYVAPPVIGMPEFQLARQAAEKLKAEQAAVDPTSPSQPMPADAVAPRMAGLPPGVERAEPIA
jgi:hypothetical protein